MNFDLNSAAEKLQSTNYQTTGIFDNVVVSKVTQGVSANGNKYIQLETTGANGELGRSQDMYLTDKAWPVTGRTILELIKATHKIEEDEAKSKIKVETEDQLAAKESVLLVGRKFRAKFRGQETSKGAIIAQLGGQESMRVAREVTSLKFNPEKDIRKYQGTSALGVTTPANIDALPF